MMQQRLRPVATIMVAAILCALAMAGVASAAGSPSGGPVTFRVGVLQDMTTMSPFKACCASEYETFYMVYDQLYGFSPKDGSPVSDLAYWPPSVNSDSTQYTFKIRSDMKWSDGTPLTASDIAFTYNYIIKNNMGVYINYLGPTQSVVAKDATTLVWTFKQPSLAPEAPPYIPIVPQHVWQNLNKQQALDYHNVPTVGSGPFKLVSWKQGVSWTLQANKAYPLGAPHVDQIVFQVFNDPQAMVLALRNGSIDFAEGLPPTLYNSLIGAPNVQTHKGSALSYVNLVMNTDPKGSGNPALQNPAVRTAIAWAINRQSLVDKVLAGDGIVGSSIVLPSNSRWAWQPDSSTYIGYDPAKAKQMIQSAGYKIGSGGYFIDPKTGGPLTLGLLVLANTPQSYQSGPLIQGFLKAIGIDVKVTPESGGKLLQDWGNNAFDMYIWGQYPEPPPDPDYILSVFTTAQCGNLADTCWNNTQYNQLYTQQQSATTYSQRYALVQQMEQIVYTQNPEIVLFYPQDLEAYRTDRFTGFVPQPSPNGSYIFTYGPATYVDIRPVPGSAQAAAKNTQGLPAGVWVGAGIAVIVIIVIGVAIARRRGNEEDRA